MSRLLYRWGRWSATRPWLSIGAWVLGSILVVAGSAGFGKQLDDSMAAPGTDSQAAADLLAGADSGAGGLTAYVVATSSQDGEIFVDSRRARVGLDRLESAVGDLPKVLGTTQQVSPDGRVALVRVQYPEIGELAVSDLEALKTVLAESRASSSLRLEAGGDLYFSFEQPPANVGEVIGLVVAAVILLVAFGSLLAAGLPIAVALFGLLVGASSLPLLGPLVDIPVWAPVMAAMVGLGGGIDYALFPLSRHREYLTAGVPVAESVGRSMATAGQAVVFAGGTVVVAILGLGFAGLPFVSAAGVGISAVVLVMVLAAITLLPALLGLAGHRLQTRGPLLRRGHGHEPGADAAVLRWSRWGAHVSRHAAAYAVAGTMLLLALAAPVLALRLGLPDQNTRRRAPRGGPTTWSPRASDPAPPGRWSWPSTSRGTGRWWSRWCRPWQPTWHRVGRSRPGGGDVRRRRHHRPAHDDTTGRRDGPDAGPGAQRGAAQRVGDQPGDRARRRLHGHHVRPQPAGRGTAADFPGRGRGDVVPTLADGAVPFHPGAQGSGAEPVERSRAAYGVLVMVFQWGWVASLIGLESTVPIILFIPLFMFAILFGLSMDYEVFLLSRVREEYLRTRDNHAAVVRGIRVTARTISCGAAIMVSVFVGFGFGDDPR